MPRNVIALIAAAALGATAPALAAEQAPATQTNTIAVAPKGGEVIRDASGRRIGVVDSVRDGTVMVITSTKMVHIPISTVSVGSAGLQTSLKSAELR
jgi:hypothetical protein